MLFLSNLSASLISFGQNFLKKLKLFIQHTGKLAKINLKKKEDKA